MNTFEIGIVGLGYWGPNVLRNFYKIGRANVKYACDLDESRLKSIASDYPSVAITQDYDQLLNDPDLDAIAIATPVTSHYELCKQALEAGKHVLVEKPMTATGEQAEELVALADSKKLVLMVDHTFIYTGAVKKIKELVDAGELGDLFYFDSQRMNLGLLQKDIDVAWDLAPHDFSILEHIVDKRPVSVMVTGGGFVGSPDLAEVAYITVKYADGFFAHVAVSWLSPVKLRQVIVCGSKKMVLYNDVEPAEKIRVYDKGVDMDWDAVTPFNPAYRSGDVSIPKLDMAEALKAEAEHFADCVLDGKTPITSGRDGANVVKLLEAASRSLKEGKAITLGE